jgi:O-antigen/teichoic acid export membrane protein
MALGAAGSVLAARLLGPNGRGQLAAIVAWVGLAAALGDIGISQACAYYGAKSRSREGTVAGTSLAMGVGISFVVILGILPIRSRLFGDGLAGPASLYLFTIPLGVIATYLAAILQGMSQLGSFNAIRVVQASAYTLALVIAMSLGWAHVGTVVVAIVLCQCFATAISVRIASRFLPFEGWRLDKTTARGMLAYGGRTYAGNLFWLMNGRLDQALLSLFAPMRELGMYAVAVSYSGILFGLSGALASVVFPRVAGAATVAAGRRELHNTLRGLALLTLPLAAIMALGVRWVIPAVFGSAFDAARRPAYILLAGGVLLGLNYVLSNALRASGRPGAPAFGEAAGMVVTVSALPIVLPRWGITGAAWVSVFSYALTTIVLWALWNRKNVSMQG